ncbi:hypothetical protein [Aureliella helgolandensis]|uniref:hypothetical protein n=1 Tax=Aureliella helgolandensis TaxID=2527968 RepID=UPI0018D05F15|nr:hypothetical protein [Aureliella helgolandensis]
MLRSIQQLFWAGRWRQEDGDGKMLVERCWWKDVGGKMLVELAAFMARLKKRSWVE